MSTMCIGFDTLLNLEHTLTRCDYTANGSKYQHAGLVDSDWNGRPVQWGFHSTHNPNNKEYDGLFRFFRLMAVLNHRAYWRAYSARHDVDRFEPLTREDYTPRILPIVQVLKSLQAIRYNIHGVNDDLNDLIDGIQSAFFDNLPEYDSATWG